MTAARNRCLLCRLLGRASSRPARVVSCLGRAHRSARYAIAMCRVLVFVAILTFTLSTRVIVRIRDNAQSDMTSMGGWPDRPRYQEVQNALH